MSSGSTGVLLLLQRLYRIRAVSSSWVMRVAPNGSVHHDAIAPHETLLAKKHNRQSSHEPGFQELTPAMVAGSTEKSERLRRPRGGSWFGPAIT